MSDRAHLEGPRGDGTFKWCVFPCQFRKTETPGPDDREAQSVGDAQGSEKRTSGRKG